MLIRVSGERPKDFLVFVTFLRFFPDKVDNLEGGFQHTADLVFGRMDRVAEPG
jgi:hypothetical protein